MVQTTTSTCTTERKRKERPLTSYFPAKRTNNEQPAIDPSQRSSTSTPPVGSATSRTDDDTDAAGTNSLNKQEDTSDEPVENSDCSSSTNVEAIESDETNDKETPPSASTTSTCKEMNRTLYTTTQNIAHRIVQQTTTGNRNLVPRILSPHWECPKGLAFDAPNRQVSHLQFDAAGVLLAVAFAETGTVAVYDWDTVQAFHLKTRRTLQRIKRQRHTQQQQQQHPNVQPILQFRLPLQAARAFSSISFLHWNPFQQDILAVGNRSTGAVHLYDLGHIMATTDQASSTPHNHTFTELHTGVSAPTESSILFLNQGRQALVSSDETLSLWNIHTHKRLWKWKWKTSSNARISSMVAIPTRTSWVLLGSNRGDFAFLDVQKLQRAAFSTTPSPTLLKQWKSYRTLQISPSSFATPTMMGIRNVVVDSLLPNDKLIIGWVTFGGWHLTAQMDVGELKTVQRMTQVHHEPPLVSCQNARGEPVDPPRVQWSAPPGHKVHAASTSDAAMMVWQDVPAVTQILPGADSRVALADQSSYVRLNARSPLVVCKFSGHDCLSRIPVSKRRGAPTCLAVHPSQEWIVVGTKKHQFYAMHARPTRVLEEG